MTLSVSTGEPSHNARRTNAMRMERLNVPVNGRIVSHLVLDPAADDPLAERGLLHLKRMSMCFSRFAVSLPKETEAYSYCTLWQNLGRASPIHPKISCI